MVILSGWVLHMLYWNKAKVCIENNAYIGIVNGFDCYETSK